MHVISWITLISGLGIALGLLIYAADWLYNRLNLDNEMIGAVVAASSAAVFIVFGIGAVITYAENKSCQTIAVENEVDFHYGMNAGCRLELQDGRFVPEERWRVQEDR